MNRLSLALLALPLAFGAPAMASTPVVREPAAYAGAWTLRAAGPRARACRLVLRVDAVKKPPRTGFALEAARACLAGLSLQDLLMWRPESEGVVIEREDARDVLLFAAEARGRYVARGRDGRVRYTLTRS